jgi:hypothetical protein
MPPLHHKLYYNLHPFTARLHSSTNKQTNKHPPIHPPEGPTNPQQNPPLPHPSQTEGGFTQKTPTRAEYISNRRKSGGGVVLVRPPP